MGVFNDRIRLQVLPNKQELITTSSIVQLNTRKDSFFLLSSWAEPGAMAPGKKMKVT